MSSTGPPATARSFALSRSVWSGWGGGFSCHVALLDPKSRGQVSLASRDPLAAPVIDPNFLGDPADLEKMVAGFKLARRLMDAPALHALRTRDLFTAHVETDDDIRAVLRDRVDSVYHPVGTCRMAPDPPTASSIRNCGRTGYRPCASSTPPSCRA